MAPKTSCNSVGESRRWDAGLGGSVGIVVVDGDVRLEIVDVAVTECVVVEVDSCRSDCCVLVNWTC